MLSRVHRRFGRRALVTGSVAALATRGTIAHASEATPFVVPLFVRVVTVDGAPVADGTFVDERLAVAAPIYAEHALSFVEAKPRTPVVGRADVVTRDDRDSFAPLCEDGVVNVFVVRRLEDVDEPGRSRMGVAWRCLRDPTKRYVVMAAYARPAVLAHELGHFLGNPHSKVKNNLMSYEHEEGARIFLDAAQGRRARETARALFPPRRSGS